MRIQSLLSSPRRLVAIGGIALVAATAACGPAVVKAPVGGPTDYSTNVYTGWVQRWNPCTPIHYKVNLTGVPAELSRVTAAVNTLSKATGLHFVYDGTTTYIPQVGGWNQPSQLVIAFAKHNGKAGGSTYLGGVNQLGEGGFQSTYMTTNGKITSYKITKAYAVLDSAAYSANNSKVRQDTLLHELGHAVGLNHAKNTNEIMYPVISNSSPASYGAGDLSGLSKVGSGQGCIS